MRQRLYMKRDSNEHSQECQTDVTGPRADGQDDVGRLVSLPNQGWWYLHVCVDDASRIAYTDLGGLFPTPLYHLHPCRREHARCNVISIFFKNQ